MSCAKTRYLWRMTFFAQLISHQTKLISFENSAPCATSFTYTDAWV